MEEPSTGVILTLWIAIMAAYYPLILGVVQNPDLAHIFAGIITLFGGIISAILIAYLWDKQYSFEKNIRNNSLKQLDKK